MLFKGHPTKAEDYSIENSLTFNNHIVSMPIFIARSQLGELQILRHKFQNQQSRLQEILVCLDVGMTYLHDTKQLKEYFCVIYEHYIKKIPLLIMN